MDRSVPAEAGENLLETAMKAGVHINASCGGRGVCGKCRVRVVGGSLVSPVHPSVGEEGHAAGI
ncbi:MAG TPA: 2Fe-2S iron-sulfur cluster-binding protein, partial [Syntrophorhabdaceae bacterium]|nr:2Fe-2S iron-sulfur cluster-binding protein [Syntrophorhabdaceae bacterium]